MIKDILNKAKNFCTKNKHRFTDPRKKVLRIIASSKKPIKAYEVLDKLGGLIENPKPPTAYRAIEFWEKYNFIHRIESLNAYSLCESNHLHNGTQFLICYGCGNVTESHFNEIQNIIKKSLKKQTFIPSKWNLEIKGLCSKCI